MDKAEMKIAPSTPTESMASATVAALKAEGAL